MKSWNPFTIDQWIIWVISTGIAGVSGTIAVMSYADSHFENKEQAALKHEFKQNQLNEIKQTLEQIDGKVDRLIERR